MFLKSRSTGPFLCALLVGVCCSTTASAQPESRGPKSGSYDAIIDNADLLINNYARFLTRRYDLTGEQDEFTVEMIRERAYAFIDQNEEQLRSLVGRMFEVRAGAEMTPEELVEWGEQVRPIYDQAKELITAANDEWRQILTDEQRVIHDGDVAMMNESFETTDEQIEQIVSGEMTVDEFRNPQRAKRKSRRTEQPRVDVPPARDRSTVRRNNPQQLREVDDREADQPPAEPAERLKSSPRPASRAKAALTTPERPRQTRSTPAETPTKSDRSSRRETSRAEARRGAASEDNAAKSRSRGSRSARGGAAKADGFEGQWDKYVQDFITRYELNDEQSQKANTVLETCKQQGDRYLTSRKSQIEQIDQQLNELKTSKDRSKRQQVSKLTEQKTKLMAGLDHIFERQLKPRLEKLPTRAQRRAAEQAAKRPTNAKKSKKSDADAKKDKE